MHALRFGTSSSSGQISPINALTCTSLCLVQPLAHFLAHLVAEFGTQRRALLLVDVMAIEHVEFVQDVVALARHGEDPQPLGHWPDRSLDLPAPAGVGAAGPRDP